LKSLSDILTQECLDSCLHYWRRTPSLLLVGSLDSEGLISGVRSLGEVGTPEDTWEEPPEFGEIVLQPDHTEHLLPIANNDWMLESLSKQGVGLYLVGLEERQIHPIVEPVRVGSQQQLLTTEDIHPWFAQDGLLASQVSRFEERPQQTELSWAVGEALNQERVLLVEAGTGTGKSLAYLIPAMLWASKNRERVVISTGTIPLQEQLHTKEIPLLQRLLPRPLRVALVKGRQNYLCLRRLEQAHGTPLVEEELEEWERLVEWSEVTRSGDRSEWETPLSSRLWKEVQTESESCQRSQCPLYQQCFYYRSRRDLASADLLITNHHLLLADLAMRHQTGNYESTVILPPYHRLVLDEAHHLEDVASSFLGFSTSQQSILQSLHRLRPSSRIPGSSPALLLELGHALARREGSPQEVARQEQMLDNLKVMWLPTLVQVGRGTREASEKIQQILRESSHQELPTRIRVNQNLLYQGPWALIRDIGLQWSESVHEMVAPLKEIIQTLDRWKWLEKEEWKSWAMDVRAVQKHLERSATVLSSFFAPSMDNPEPEEQPLVRWFESDETWMNHLQLVAAPLAVEQAMQELLWEPMKTVVMTSATMTQASGDFSFVKQRLGLGWIPEHRLDEHTFPSPFAYESHSQLLIPTDLPEPNAEHFAETIVEPLKEFLLASNGRAFVLCTSYQLMNFLYSRLKEPLAQEGIQSLCQGKASRSWLLSEKKRDATSVLFGTDSFWEGVDVQGDALQNVILTRLPFRMPTEPLLQARMKALEANGQNSFLHYVVPMAVLRFKQGFGRLIRSQRDRGSVVLLDRRALTKEYGQMFLQSLPEGVPVFEEDWRSIAESIRRFHGDE
jgi:ATP-dependent DNA helicase DinG